MKHKINEDDLLVLLLLEGLERCSQQTVKDEAAFEIFVKVYFLTFRSVKSCVKIILSADKTIDLGDQIVTNCRSSSRMQ